jgi:hypothetical protein
MAEEIPNENNDIPLEPKEPIDLNLMAVIGFNGGVVDGLILHPDNETLIFPLGSQIVVRMYLPDKTHF